MGANQGKQEDQTTDQNQEEENQLPEGTIIPVGDEKKYYINHIAGIASGEVVPIVDDQPVNGPPTIRGDTIYYSNGSEILKWLDEDPDKGLYLISISDDNRKLMKKVKDMLKLNTSSDNKQSSQIQQPTQTIQPMSQSSSEMQPVEEQENENYQRESGEMQPQYGGIGKVFYKGYYYKVRKQGRKLFIKTKNEGDISFTKVQRWANRHCKY